MLAPLSKIPRGVLSPPPLLVPTPMWIILAQHIYASCLLKRTFANNADSVAEHTDTSIYPHIYILPGWSGGAMVQGKLPVPV